MGGGAGLVFGLPSALSMPVFQNQDWVWGVGLILSGLFFALGARRFGVEKLRREVVNAPGADLDVGRWWSFVIYVLVPLEAVILLVWWLYQAVDGEVTEWLHPIATFNVGTVLFQWAIALGALLLLNRWLAERTATPDGGEAS